MTFTQLTAWLKTFLMDWLLVLSLKEGLVECATVCVKSEVILIFTYLPANKLQSSVNWLSRQILFSLSSFRCTYLSLFQLWGVGQELRVSTSRSPCVTLSKICNRLEIRNWSWLNRNFKKSFMFQIFKTKRNYWAETMMCSVIITIQFVFLLIAKTIKL